MKKIRTRKHRKNRRLIVAIKWCFVPITWPLFIVFFAYEWWYHNVSTRIINKGNDLYDWIVSL